ncbi:hypothetical protein NSS98_25415 [Paenibacillus sp. FSL E2-0274]|uniref:hypothetical protein n=1 Tax=Paenibacillus TaxID=44249 RepID=UPI00096CAE84|nr:hypothetical protein [Paenibacillus odorifer]OME25834.1 hypothetical protein BSK63_28305 [Paenibacillus odorifer]
MKRLLGQRIAAWLGVTMPSTALEAHPEFYLPVSVYKDSFKCHYCSNISPGKWCLHCDIHPARGTYYDEHGHPCKPTARIQPISKGRSQGRAPKIVDELSEYKASITKQPHKEESKMYKGTVHSREELFRVTEALDRLSKDYTVVKQTGSRGSFEQDECGQPLPPKHDVWHVSEVESQSGAPITVGDIKVKVDMDTSGIETALEEVRELLTRPLSDFVTIQVGEDNASQD